VRIAADSEDRQPNALHERLLAMRQAQQGWHAESAPQSNSEESVASAALKPACDHDAR